MFSTNEWLLSESSKDICTPYNVFSIIIYYCIWFQFFFLPPCLSLPLSLSVFWLIININGIPILSHIFFRLLTNKREIKKTWKDWKRKRNREKKLKIEMEIIFVGWFWFHNSLVTHFNAYHDSLDVRNTYTLDAWTCGKSGATFKGTHI